MLDHQEARMWADHHDALNHLLTELLASLRESFEVLAAIRYDQPWKREPRCPATKI